jgi:hypothetical protein
MPNSSKVAARLGLFKSTTCVAESLVSDCRSNASTAADDCASDGVRVPANELSGALGNQTLNIIKAAVMSRPGTSKQADSQRKPDQKMGELHGLAHKTAKAGRSLDERRNESVIHANASATGLVSSIVPRAANS